MRSALGACVLSSTGALCKPRWLQHSNFHIRTKPDAEVWESQRVVDASVEIEGSDNKTGEAKTMGQNCLFRSVFVPEISLRDAQLARSPRAAPGFRLTESSAFSRGYLCSPMATHL